MPFTTSGGPSYSVGSSNVTSGGSGQFVPVLQQPTYYELQSALKTLANELIAHYPELILAQGPVYEAYKKAIDLLLR